MTKAPNQSRASTVKSRGRTFRRSFSCPSILIGRERTAAAETGVTWKKVRSRLYDAVAFKLRSTDGELSRDLIVFCDEVSFIFESRNLSIACDLFLF